MNAPPYKLKFLKQALKEWHSLPPKTQTQFKKKLLERTKNPHIPANRLSGPPNRYKIKLRSIGYRLVYEVVDNQLVITFIAVGKRDKNKVYKKAKQRLLV